MATYKKRGYKPKTNVEKQQNIEDGSTTAEVFNTLDETASKTEDFVAKNQKYIFIIIGLVAVIVLGSLAYKEYVAKPKQQAAMNDMFQAQKYFDEAVTGTAKDSLYNLALNGGEGKFGMLDIIQEYSGTPSANLASYYAGTAYLRLKDYKNAIYYLDEFSSKDLILLSLAYGSIGDAYLELNEHDKSLKFYEKAFGLDENNFTTPKFLFKAGLLSSSLNKKNKALKYFKKITNDFPDSREYNFVEAQIGRLENIN